MTIIPLPLAVSDELRHRLRCSCYGNSAKIGGAQAVYKTALEDTSGLGPFRAKSGKKQLPV